MSFHKDGFVSRHPWEWIFVPILMASSLSEFENEHFFMQCGSVQVGRSWKEYSSLAKEKTPPMFSVFIQCALQDFSPVLGNLLYPLKGVSFIFCSQKQQQLKNLQYQCLYPHGSACVTDTQRGIFQPERQKHMQRSNLSWWHWLPGSWPAYEVSGRSCWLPSGWLGKAWQGLTGCSSAATSGLNDNLAGRSGARSRAAICSLPQPSCPQQPYFFSLQAAAPPLYLCVRVPARLSLW